MNKQKGSFGEFVAVRYLENKGLKVLARNYVSRYGEVDVIASSGDYLVFVEVKLRNGRALVPGRVFVGPVKQKKIVKTALTYVCETNRDANMRFDVVEIKCSNSKENKSPEILYFENAFYADDLFLEAA